MAERAVQLFSTGQFRDCRAGQMQRVIELQRVRVARFFRNQAELWMIGGEVRDGFRFPLSAFRFYPCHLRRITVAERAVRIRRRRHLAALMLRVAERTGNLRRVRLMKISSRVTFQTGLVDRRRFLRFRQHELFQIQNPRLRVQSRACHPARAVAAGGMARAAALVEMIRRRQRRERRAGVRLGNRSGIDEVISPWRIAQHDEQHCARRGDDRERDAPAPPAQRRHRRTFRDRPAATAVR